MAQLVSRAKLLFSSFLSSVHTPFSLPLSFSFPHLLLSHHPFTSIRHSLDLIPDSFAPSSQAPVLTESFFLSAPALFSSFRYESFAISFTPLGNVSFDPVPCVTRAWEIVLPETRVNKDASLTDETVEWTAPWSLRPPFATPGLFFRPFSKGALVPFGLHPR